MERESSLKSLEGGASISRHSAGDGDALILPNITSLSLYLLSLSSCCVEVFEGGERREDREAGSERGQRPRKCQFR